MTASPRQSCFPRVLDIGLRKGLSDSLYMQFADSRVRDLLAQNAECAACPHRLKCGGGCRAAALAGSGQDLLACDRQMCGFWKGGYEEKILAALRRAEQAYGTPPPQG